MATRHRATPYVGTFCSFLLRAHEQLNTAATSANANIKIFGAHAGLAINNSEGEEPCSQTGLADLALFRSLPNSVILYPSDAYSTVRAVELIARHVGLCYVRVSRPIWPLLYGPDEQFHFAQLKRLRGFDDEPILALIGAGSSLHFCLEAAERLQGEGITVGVVDLFSVRPLDVDGLKKVACDCSLRRLVCVEDHYKAGGIGEAIIASVSSPNEGIVVHSLFVKDNPDDRMAAGDDKYSIMDRYGIGPRAIGKFVRSIVDRSLA